ncbi:siderophore ferric iron reductase [Bordetella petrii]|uniref:siderophore ferric iron reductase n=1 Tax=Bordetella petrii TaxID=94624 RepID=UPI00372F89AD
MAATRPAARDREALEGLLTRADQALPGLRCRPAAPGEPVVAAESGHPGLPALRDFWARAHPEAGPHYLSMRCWGLAIWQPIYLCVLAAHLDTCVPQLDGAQQPWSARDGFTHGVWLPPHAPAGGALEQRIARGAAEVARFCTRMHAAMQPVLAVPRKAADATVAECVLAAVLLAARCARADVAPTRAWADRWLSGIGVAAGCGLLAYQNARGDPALMLDRKICCHHFRRRDGDKCASCPKLTQGERIRRMQADAN